MSALLERRIKARQRIVEIDGHRFVLRRPTEYDRVRNAERTVLEYAAEMVDDCNLTEADLFDGGSAEVAVPFDRALFFDWLSEHSRFWKPLTEALADMVKTHDEQLEAAAKN